MTYHARVREMVPETCPQIDRAIKAIRDAYRYVSRLPKHADESDLREAVEGAEWELRDVEDDLEKLRRANAELREIACEALARADELETEGESKP